MIKTQKLKANFTKQINKRFHSFWFLTRKRNENDLDIDNKREKNNKNNDDKNKFLKFSIFFLFG